MAFTIRLMTGQVERYGDLDTLEILTPGILKLHVDRDTPWRKRGIHYIAPHIWEQVHEEFLT